MREIKFRAWDKKENCWFDSWCIHCNGHYSDATEAEIKNNPNSRWKDIPKNLVIMQFIGLLDKNGKKIYEGDIVEWQSYKEITKGWELDSSKNFLGKVIFENSAFLCQLLENKAFVSLNPTSRIKIIGNIYENPELLTNSNPNVRFT